MKAKLLSSYYVNRNKEETAFKVSGFPSEVPGPVASLIPLRMLILGLLLKCNK